VRKKIKSQSKQKSFEEQYKRRTLWIHKDYSQLLDEELKNGGNITKVINTGLRLYYNMKAQGLLDDK
jgi:hypothetical protein